MTQQRTVRPGECLVIAAVSTSLSVAAHATAGGTISALSVATVAAVSALAALVAFRGRPARVPGLVTLLFGGQIVGHVVMHLGHMSRSVSTPDPHTAMGHGAAHGAMAHTMPDMHPATGDVGMGLLPSTPMLVAHLLAAVATAVVLAGALAARISLTRAYRRAILHVPAPLLRTVVAPNFADLLDITAAGHRDLVRSRGPPLPA